MGKDKQLQSTLKNIHDNHSDVWEQLSREADRLLNKTNEDIKHKFVDCVNPADISFYLKTSMPRSCLEEIDRTSKLTSSVRAAIMLIEKVFHFDDSFYHFLEALIKNSQASLVHDLLKCVAINKPDLGVWLPQRAEHGSLRTPTNSNVQGSTATTYYASQAAPVDNVLQQQQPPSSATGDMISAARSVDSYMNNSRPQLSSTEQSDMQVSHGNQADQAIAASGSTMSWQSGNMLSAAQAVDVNMQQELVEKERIIQQQQQQLQRQQQQLQGLERGIIGVYGSMDNFRSRVQESSTSRHNNSSAEPQAGVFDSTDFASGPA